MPHCLRVHAQSCGRLAGQRGMPAEPRTVRTARCCVAALLWCSYADAIKAMKVIDTKRKRAAPANGQACAPYDAPRSSATARAGGDPSAVACAVHCASRWASPPSAARPRLTVPPAHGVPPRPTFTSRLMSSSGQRIASHPHKAKKPKEAASQYRVIEGVRYERDILELARFVRGVHGSCHLWRVVSGAVMCSVTTQPCAGLDMIAHSVPRLSVCRSVLRSRLTR